MNRFRLLLSVLFFFSSLIGTSATMVVFDADNVSAQTRPKKVKRKRKRRRSRRPTSFVGVRLGGILTAPGELSVANSDNTIRFDDESGFGINGMAIFAIQNQIRGGASIWLFPGFETASSNRGGEVSGTMVNLNAQGEFVLPVSRQVEGFAFGEAGLSILNSDDNDIGDFLGFNGGLGLGAQFLVSGNLAIRAEGKGELYNITNNDDNEVTLNATRVMLNVGVLFGL